MADNIHILEKKLCSITPGQSNPSELAQELWAAKNHPSHLRFNCGNSVHADISYNRHGDATRITEKDSHGRVWFDMNADNLVYGRPAKQP